MNPYTNASDAISSGATRPDDLLGIRNQIYADVGVNDALKAVQDAKQNLTTFDETTNAQQQTISDRRVSMNKLTGIGRSNLNKRALERGSYATQAQTARDMYATKLAEANTQLSIKEKDINEKKQLMSQYQGAGINFNDTFESAMGKIEKYSVKLKKEAKKEAEYNSLRDAYMQVFGYPPKKKYSRKKLRKKIKKRSERMLKRAEDRAEQEWKMKVEEHNMQMANTRSAIANRGARTEKTPRIITQQDESGETSYFTYNNETGQLDPVQVSGQEAPPIDDNKTDGGSFWDTLGWGVEKVKNAGSWLGNAFRSTAGGTPGFQQTEGGYTNPWANFWK